MALEIEAIVPWSTATMEVAIPEPVLGQAVPKHLSKLCKKHHRMQYLFNLALFLSQVFCTPSSRPDFAGVGVAI